MSFRLEAEMKIPVIKWMEEQNLYVKSEFNTPWGICDLVGVDFNQENVKKRLDYGQKRSIGSLLKATLLDAIPDSDTEEKKSITRNMLYKLYDDYIGRDKIDSELNRLVKNRFIENAGKNRFSKLNGWLPVQNRVVAIELKLNRIQEALFQAYNHCLFTTESYVALPEDVAIRVMSGKKADDFIVWGVGLISVSKSKCEVLIEPRLPATNVDKIMQTYIVDNFWTGYLKDNLT